MWLTLVGIEPALLGDGREQPRLVGELLDGRGRDDALDAHGEDYRVLHDIAQGRAEVEEGSVEWRTVYPALARATGDGCAVVDVLDSGDEAAFVLTSEEVARVAEGLGDEGWTRFLEIARFYVKAAAEGRAVVGRMT
jgi:hypothetical protein